MTQASEAEAVHQIKNNQTVGLEKNASSEIPPSWEHNSDILLNNFQINKKNHRVLLNGNHLVWEPLTIAVKRHEGEQRMQQSAYGRGSKVLHLDDIICIFKANTKNESLKKQHQHGPSTDASETAVPTARYLTLHYGERVQRSAADCNRWQVRRLTLCNADPYIVKRWYDQLSELLGNSSRLRVRHLLVFINPYGGRKKALTTYEKYCKPLFNLAGIDASCIISQRANQIRDILMTHDLSLFDAVCCVGGDGTTAEVINGLLFRAMRELGLDERQPAYIPKPILPVGVIPAGSTDTIAYSMHGTSDVTTAAIHLIMGQRRGLDVCSVRSGSKLLRFCASILSYGYLGDVAANSEQYRWMGPKRYEYAGFKAFMSNRGYDAEMRILLMDDANERDTNLDFQQPTTSRRSATQSNVDEQADKEICYVNCKRCSIAASVHELTERDMASSGVRSESQSLKRQLSQESGHGTAADNGPNYQSHFSHSESSLLRHLKILGTTSTQSEHFPAGDESVSGVWDLPDGQWKTIKGNFFMVCGANITCACARSPNGFSRYSHLGDGCLDLILVRKTTLLNNLRFLLNTTFRKGDIRNLPFVELYRTRQFGFRILRTTTHGEEAFSINGSCQPIAEQCSPVNANISSWNCDGEVVTDLDITMTSHCQLIDVFMRGPHSYDKASSNATIEDSTSMFVCCKD